MMTSCSSMVSLILGVHFILINNILAGANTMSPEEKQAMQFMMSISTHDQPTGQAKGNDTARSFLHIQQRHRDLIDHNMKRMPRRKHLKANRLMRRMGKDFDTFWMSHTRPDDYSKMLTKRNEDLSLRTDASSLNLQHVAEELYESIRESDTESEYFSQNASETDNIINSTSTTNTILHSSQQTISKMADNLQSWLIKKATCSVYYKWVDFGLRFWPRFIRAGSCTLPIVENPLEDFFFGTQRKQSNDSSSSSTTLASPPMPSPSTACSWPPGKFCSPGEEKKLRLLKWNCRYHSALEGLGKSRKADKKGKNGTLDATSHEDDNHVDHNDDDENDDEYHHHSDDESHDVHVADDSPGMDDHLNGLFSKLTKIDDSPLQDKKSRHSRLHFQLGKKDEKRKLDIDDLLAKMMSEVPDRSTRQLRHLIRTPGFGTNSLRTKRDARRKDGDTRHKHRNHNHGRAHKRGKGRRRSGVRCRWEKFTLPVIDECFCTC